MSAEDLLRHFHDVYKGVYLSVTHTCRLLPDRPVTHEWMFWHGGAGEHVGPGASAEALLAMVRKWEASGERLAACNLRMIEEVRQKRLEYLTRKRLEEERVADPAYVPTVDEAARHPDAFVEGMTEQSFEMDPRD